jgi:hypothetical protein
MNVLNEIITIMIKILKEISRYHNVLVMNNLIITYIILSIGLLSCSNSDTTPTVCFLKCIENPKEFKILYSRLNVSERDGCKIILSENYKTIMNLVTGSLDLFDKEGRKVNLIATRGIKDGEFCSYYAHSIDEKIGVVYLLDYFKVHRYKLNGQYLGFFEIMDKHKPTYGYPDDLIITNEGNLIIHINNNMGYAKYDYIIFDSLGVVQNTHANNLTFSRDRDASFKISPGIVSFKYNNTVNVKDIGDTLFRISQKEFIPAYIFNINWGEGVPAAKTTNEKYFDELPRFRFILENSDSLFFIAEGRLYRYAGYLNKSNKKGEIFSNRAINDINQFEVSDKSAISSRNNSNNNSVKKEFKERIKEFEYQFIQVQDNRYIATEMVSHKLWKSVTGKSHPDYNGIDNMPVTNISWYTAEKFTKMLSKASGKSYRLPTESEWLASRIHLRREDETLLEWCFEWYNQFEENSYSHYLGPYSGTLKKAIGNRRVNLPPNLSNFTNGFRLALEL